MLSPADADLAARDPALPGLATLLDAEAFLEALRAAAPAARLARAVPRYIRYKPGTNCLVAYRLEGPEGGLDVHAKAFGRDAAVKLDKAAGRAGAAGALGCARFAIAGRGIVVWVFPNDAELPALERLAHPEARRRLLARALPGHPALWDGALATLAYKPERRYVACAIGSDGMRLALKFYPEEEFAAASDHAKRYRSRGALRLPERRGALAAHGLLALEWLAGEGLADAIAAGRSAACAPVGAALAELHSRRGSRLPARTRAGDAVLAGELARALAELWPPHGGRATRLAERIAGALPDHAAQPACLVHGDFHDRQVILTDGAAAILDLDRAARACPQVDLGSFRARLLRRACLGELPEPRACEAAAALREGYQAARRAALGPGLAAYTALALLQLAAEPFREHAPDWPSRIGALLGCAESALAAGDGRA